jgi:hypothetical protein
VFCAWTRWKSKADRDFRPPGHQTQSQHRSHGAGIARTRRQEFDLAYCDLNENGSKSVLDLIFEGPAMKPDHLLRCDVTMPLSARRTAKGAAMSDLILTKPG